MAIKIINSNDIFTDEQLEHHAKIYAGPGAGKTHFLVENIKNIVTANPLITHSQSRKVLCVTYTNAAVDEIKQRLGKYSDSVEVSTIHSFIINHIIQPFQQDLRKIMSDDFKITVEDKGTISSQIEGLSIIHGVDKNDIYNFICTSTDTKSEIGNLHYTKKAMESVEVNNKSFIESIRNKTPNRSIKLKADDESIATEHIKPIKEYVWSKVKKLTHNEILYFGYRIVESNPIVLYILRVKFPFIFIDEFQDTNPLQTLLIQLIGEKSTWIGVVGDIAQSIYSFQGAYPADFQNFNIAGDRTLDEYAIKDNRRSTDNIVNFCNLLRQADQNVIQSSIREHNSTTKKESAESQSIHFLLGNSQAIQDKIKSIINQDGVVLTRAWAAAFNYMTDVSDDQKTLLKRIYNSYFNSPIIIRDEILKHNNVTWVRAFRFIFSLWSGYSNNSFIDVVNALKLYCDIDLQKDRQKLNSRIIFQIGKLSETVFREIKEGNTEICTYNIIEKFKSEIGKPDYYEFQQSLFTPESIVLFNELDKQTLQDNVRQLSWRTSYKLFHEVFSENSQFMTVHQAKGLEWDKVIVAVSPTRFDAIGQTINIFSNPQLVGELPCNEFTRIYYVACSRAKEELYIHIQGTRIEDAKSVIKNAIDTFEKKASRKICYDFMP